MLLVVCSSKNCPDWFSGDSADLIEALLSVKILIRGVTVEIYIKVVNKNETQSIGVLGNCLC